MRELDLTQMKFTNTLDWRDLEVVMAATEYLEFVSHKRPDAYWKTLRDSVGQQQYRSMIAYKLCPHIALAWELVGNDFEDIDFAMPQFDLCFVPTAIDVVEAEGGLMNLNLERLVERLNELIACGDKSRLSFYSA